MIQSLLTNMWMLWSGQAQQVADMISAAVRAGLVTAGPVDEASRDGLPIQKLNNVAIIKTSGPMIKNAGWLTRYGLAGTRETQAALLSAAADDDIEQIAWVMDTPGGSVDGLEELANVVAQVNAQKPITVQVDGLLASAGYYVASQAGAIYASPGDLIGSIGTRTALYDFSKLYEEAGVKAIPVDTGEHKSAGLPGTKITDAQIAEFQRIVDGYFEMFLSAVERGRGMSRKELLKVADGRVFFPEESKEYGLIDGVQTLTQTLGAIVTQAPGKRLTAKAAGERLRFLNAQQI